MYLCTGILRRRDWMNENRRIRVEYVPIGQERGGHWARWETERRFQSRGFHGILSL